MNLSLTLIAWCQFLLTPVDSCACCVCRDGLKSCQGRLEAMRARRDALTTELEQAVESNNMLVCVYCMHTHAYIRMYWLILHLVYIAPCVCVTHTCLCHTRVYMYVLLTHTCTHTYMHTHAQTHLHVFPYVHPPARHSVASMYQLYFVYLLLISLNVYMHTCIPTIHSSASLTFL